MSYKKILTIQDISCVGQCSLTVALPILSAAGMETCILPSAVLSTHTAGFSGYTVRDLSEDIPAIAAHWRRENIRFEAVYTGYLGSTEQIASVQEIFDTLLSADGVTIVDPAMADNGKLYAGFGPEFPAKMAELLDGADLVLPNLTEACLMLGEEYREGYDRAYIRRLLEGLLAKGAKTAALTGVSFEKGRLGVVSLDGRGAYSEYFTEHLPVSFHGTGDIFSSAAVGGLVRGLPVSEALALAADYTVECIRCTLAEENHSLYGVNFEQAIPYLVKRLKA